jgi:hypothetical protein
MNSNAPLSAERIQEIVEAVDLHGTKKAAADALGISRDAVIRAVRKAEENATGRAKAPERVDFGLPAKGKIARYIFTCAQSNTKLHDWTWRNLVALAEHYGARIHVSRFTYKKEAYGSKAVKPGKGATAADKADLWYDKRIEPFISDEGANVAPGLVWCGEMNILPTAIRPLSGMESYTGRKSGIFPHAKIAMESIASHKSEPTKFNYTTGAVTLRNYIAKKAGLKAEFHHGYGGLLVEVDSEGSWWCRQLNADSEGTIYDLDVRARRGHVTTGHRVEAVNWGDIHVSGEETPSLTACFGKDGILDTLRPRFQFHHDVFDFRFSNHHDRKNPHRRFELHLSGKDSGVDELKNVARFIMHDSWRDFCKTVVVDSNHDNAMTRWLREADYREDPKNALLFLAAQLEVYQAIAAGDKKFHLVSWAVNRMAPDYAATRGRTVKFLHQDESFVICPDANGGIECGMHGHQGPNGAKGSAAAFSRMGRKSNIGHSHSACIHDGTYVAGVTGALDQGYNAGPSSWSHSHVVTYANGKRAILTVWDGKWRA